MCDIRRLNKLKKTSKRFTTALDAINQADLFRREYVSHSGLTFSDLSEKLDTVKSCSSIIELKEDFIQTGDTFDQILKVSAANFCKQSAICPICADRLQARRQARFTGSIKDQARQVGEGKRYAYIVTQTVTDGDDLGERLESLKVARKNFRKMGQRRFNKKTGKWRRSGGECGKYAAAISTIEIKRGDGSGKWHVHCHELVFTDEPLDFTVYDQAERNRLKGQYGRHIPKSKLAEIARERVEFRGELVPASKVSKEWLKATAGESMGISVEPLQHVPKKANGKRKRKLKKMSFEESIAYQAKEVLKYPCKLPDNHPEDAFEIITDTFNKRMVATSGDFRGVPGDDFTDPAKEDQGTFVLIWNDQEGKYGEPQPGKLRDFIEESELATSTRSKAGKALGRYRRQRKELVAARSLYGDDLYNMLDTAKKLFRSQINAIWAVYRQAVNTEKRMDSGGCDKYSPTLALAGAWIPGSDRRDVYAAAFA